MDVPTNTMFKVSELVISGSGSDPMAAAGMIREMPYVNHVELRSADGDNSFWLLAFVDKDHADRTRLDILMLLDDPELDPHVIDVVNNGPVM